MEVAVNQTKICTHCKLEKLATREFFGVKREGLNSRCKLCVAALGRIKWADPGYHAKALRARQIRYAEPSFQEKESRRQERRKSDPAHQARESDRHQRRKKDPAYRNSELERGRKRCLDPAHRANNSAFGKQWYAANKVERSAKIKQWYENNRAKLKVKRSHPIARKRNNEWTRAHLRKHPHIKVHRSVGSAISEILKAGRIKGAFRYLPYTRADLVVHLERQFVNGMTWANYGTKWHVDHILPQASFTIDAHNPANCPEFQACWTLTNLRPLWKNDNQVKAAKRTLLL